MATVHKTTTTTVTTRTTVGGGTTTHHHTTSGGVCVMNVGYPKSAPGILKILEFLTLVVAFACLADCCRGLESWWSGKYSDYYKLFIGSTVSAWLLVIIIFLLYFFCVVSRLNAPWTVLVLVFNLVFGILIFVASALMAVYADDISGSAKGSKHFDLVIVAVVFGFISAVLLLIDAFVHFKMVKQ